MTTKILPFRRRALVLALALTGAANAAVINVDGDCTLTAAINNANSDTDTDGAGVGCHKGNGADTLILTDKAMYPLTEVAEHQTGLPWISSTITINGNDATINRSVGLNAPYFRLFHVTAAGNLTLNRLNLTGGRPDRINGGAISNNGVLTLNRCLVSGNSIAGYDSNEGAGGGIANHKTMTLNNSTVAGNTVDSWQEGIAGGILNTGNMVLNNSTVSSNSAAKNGGISNSGKMLLNDSRVSGNRSVYGGGAGISNTGKLTLDHSRISDNISTYTGVGGIENRGEAILSHSSVTGNQAYYAIVNFGKMTLSGSSVSGNSVHYAAISNFANMTLSSSLISGNGGQNSGNGSLRNTAQITISHSTISKNTNPESDGGGLWNGEAGTVTLTSSIISGNKAAGGAGISNHGNMTLHGNLISDNQVAYQTTQLTGGGGIYNSGSMTLVNNTLSANSGGQFTGGGIANKGRMTVSHCTVSGNQADINGGGIMNDLGAELTLGNSVIADSPLGGDCNNIGTLNLQGPNLIEDSGCGAPLSGDPKLARLLDNGGPTPTHALRSGSLALNAADKSFCAGIDQRGVKRPLTTKAQCDLGAFERMESIIIPNDAITIWQFFHQQVANGAITGTGNKVTAQQRLDAFNNEFMVAVHYNYRHKTEAACAQLAGMLKHIDPDNTPDANDFATGGAGKALVELLVALRADWQCQ